MKRWLIKTDNAALERLFSTCSGALVGFLVILILGAVMHFVLGDRKYIDSLRFTSITLIPLAVMNGTLSHVTNTLLETLGGGETIESLTKSAVDSPRGQIQMFCVFYMLALWMMAKERESWASGAGLCCWPASVFWRYILLWASE